MKGAVSDVEWGAQGTQVLAVTGSGSDDIVAAGGGTDPILLWGF